VEIVRRPACARGHLLYGSVVLQCLGTDGLRLTDYWNLFGLWLLVLRWRDVIIAVRHGSLLKTRVGSHLGSRAGGRMLGGNAIERQFQAMKVVGIELFLGVKQNMVLVHPR